MSLVARVLPLVAVVALVGGCAGGDHEGSAATVAPSSAPAPTTTTASSTSTAPPPTVVDTAPVETTTSVPADPTLADTPEGQCPDLVPGAIGFRNTTGRIADEYRPIGTSTEGRVIWSEHWGSRTGPQVLVLGQVHGDECGPAFLVRAIREQAPVGFGIWLVPTINPDGLAAYTRLTARAVDPNRDGFDLTTPEAQAVMHITELVQPVLTIHLHSPYGWVGAHNGVLAQQVAGALSAAAGWGSPRNAGLVDNGTLAFLWEGQERVLPGAQSVLVEFPAMSPQEAPGAPDPSQRRPGTVEEVEVAAVRIRDALYEAFAESSP